jgi:Flp pilus assembly pilin Flp
MMDLLISQLQREEEGQTMAEYAVVLAVITLLVVGALQLLSGAIGDAIGAVTDIITNNT